MGAAHDTGLSRRIALIPSICILRSVGGMRFVARNVPGIDVPPEVVARVEGAADAEAECFEIAYELASHALAQPGVAGLHFISFRKDAGIAKLCAHAWESPLDKKESPMDTVLRSRSSSVTIGADQPFCVIGERINPTGRKQFAEELRGGDLSTVTVDALAQAAAGRQHARRQRRHPAGRRARAAQVDAAHRAGRRRPADLHRLVGDRGARGRPVGLRGPRAGQLGHRRGRAPRGDPAARGQVTAPP